MRNPITTKGTAFSEDLAAIVSVDPYALELRVAGLPRTANGSHGHWRVKAANAKAWRQRIFSLAWPLRPAEPLRLARITFTRCSSVESDYDNLVISFKNCLDGLRAAGVIVDDRKANIGRPEYLWQKAPPNAGSIKVKVEAL